MGKLKGGILGPVTGKVGAVVGSVSGGQNIIKKMPSSYNDKGSESQLTQRSTFENTLRWAQALNGVLSTGFIEKPAKQSSFNAFMSANSGSGVITATPAWNNFKVSKGSLAAPDFSMNTTANTATLRFDWNDDTDGSAKMSTDKVYAVAINPATKQVVMSDGTKTRADETLTLPLPASMQGVDLQTYCFVKRADGKKASNSVRTGLGRAGSELAGSVQ
jgi:hypothetical protein